MDSKLYNEIGKAVELAKKYNTSLTEQNLLYVVKVAMDISSKTGADFDDLLGEGVYAMVKAEQKYDASQNDKFVKSCAQAVRGYMLNAINRQNFVHIPVNHMDGYKKGQKGLESAKVETVEIDSMDYDILGSVEPDVFKQNREDILNEGLKTLDINGRIAIEMKLRMGKYSEMIHSQNYPKRMEYKYSNNIQSIAGELEVPVKTAKQIYNDAFTKLSKYCQASYND